MGVRGTHTEDKRTMTDLTAKKIYEQLKTLKLPVAYGRFEEKTPLPHLIYMGEGQETFSADNTYYAKGNNYRIEYYFAHKDETIEESIEALLLENGWQYDKSEDIYISSEDVFEIYYTI